MRGRIARPETGSQLELPEVGRLKIGMKVKNQYGKEYPTSVDYFIPSGKYADLFTQSLGDKPNSIAVIFPDDDAEKVCNERYEYRDDKGALVAEGDGKIFRVWNGTKYVEYSTERIPDLMKQIAQKNPKKTQNENYDGWDIALTLRFIVPYVPGVVGVWQLSTKGQASSIKNIRNSFDGVRAMHGTVRNTVFDLSVQFAKSNKPGQNSRYPVLSLVANYGRIDEIRQMLQPKQNVSMLLPESKE